MAHIYLGLGSNVGDKKQNIETAIRLLSEKISAIERAPFYISKPMYHTEQDDFVNTVIGGETELPPEELLNFIKNVEREIGRIHRFVNGPREVDLDILLYDDLVLETSVLSIPHKGIAERAFVLKPLADIAPNSIHSIFHKTIAALLKELPPEALAEVQSLA